MLLSVASFIALFVAAIELVASVSVCVITLLGIRLSAFAFFHFVNNAGVRDPVPVEP